MKKIFPLLFLFFGTLNILSAQVKFEYDFNQGPARTGYGSWVEIDGKMYCSANDGYFGYELWQFDPATEQAHRLTDLHKQGGWSEPNDITAYEGMVYFTAYTGEFGSQLFRFDPQAWEVERVTQTQANDFQPRQTVVYLGKLWFTARLDDELNLWSYDAATGEFAEVLPPANGPSNPRNKFVYNDKLYFTATNADGKWLLWSYDGATGEFTHEPTQLDAVGSYWTVVDFVECNGEMMLNTGGGVTERWHHYDQAQDSLIFLTYNNAQVYRGGDCLANKFWSVSYADNALQIYDPASGQASTLTDLQPMGTSNPFSFKIIDGEVYFLRNGGGNNTFSKYDPADNSVEVLYEIDAVNIEMETLMEQGGNFYFFGNKDLEREVYKYTLGGTSLELIADINQANGDAFINSSYAGYFLYDGRIYLNANRDNVPFQELWAKDISSGDFINISAQLTSGEQPFIFPNAVETNGRLYFSGSRKDGEIRQLVSYATGEDSLRWHGNILPPSPLPFPHYFQGLTAYDGDLLFGAILDYEIYNQLFRFDTDTETFTLLPGTEGLSGTPLFVLEDQLFFKGSYENDLSARHFFSVDLISGELVEIANDSILGGGTDLFPAGGKVACGIRYPGSQNVLIQLYDPATGDKTEVLPAGFSSVVPNSPVAYQGKTWFYSQTSGAYSFFTLDHDTGICEEVLYLGTDTIAAGQMIWFNDELYFHGETDALGNELFVYHPTTGEISLVADLNSGPGDSSPQGLKRIGDRIYFKANDGGRGRELWSLGNCFSVSLTATPDSLGQATGAIELNIENGTAPFEFSWNNGATSQNIDGLSSGFYEVTVTDAAGCEATVFALLDGALIASADEKYDLPEINVYPNPASDILQIELSEINGKMIAFIFNYTGVEMLRENIRSEKTTLQLNDLPEGFYFLVVKSEFGGVVLKKVVVD
jgi:ELWxxDGT repeat protein